MKQILYNNCIYHLLLAPPGFYSWAVLPIFARQGLGPSFYEFKVYSIYIYKPLHLRCSCGCGLYKMGYFYVAHKYHLYIVGHWVLSYPAQWMPIGI